MTDILSNLILPGTDSYRFWQAGVSASIVYDNDKYSVVKREPLQESAIAGLVGDADLVLFFRRLQMERLSKAYIIDWK